MDHVDLVYKVDYLIQSSLLSSLMLTLIQGSFSWSTLSSWVCNIDDELVQKKERVYVPRDRELRIEIIQLHHNVPVARYRRR